MKHPACFLLACALLTPVYPAAAGEWRYDKAPVAESPAGEPGSMQAPAQPLTVSSARRSYLEPVPSNNMTMEMVRTKFGQPNNEAAPVGSPPINRWYYDEYTVYFEFDRVIISVIN